MTYRMEQMLIEAVRVVGRYRKDLGDLDSLAASIKANGLINPITVTADGYLIAGQRRLEACRRLGRTSIDARVAVSLESAIERLTAERDENTERKAMTPEELVNLGRALEALERPRAEERKAAGQFGPGHLTGTVARGETTTVVAEALGVSASTYKRAKAVVDAAEDATTPEGERQVAAAALADMNATGNVNGNYEKVRGSREARVGSRQKPVIDGAKKQRRAVGEATATLAGVAYGLQQIQTIHPDITSEEAAQWVDDLSKARRAIEVLIRRLKEHTNA